MHQSRFIKKRCENVLYVKALVFKNSVSHSKIWVEDPITQKTIWKPIDENGNEHKHKFNIPDTKKPTFLRKKVIDIAAVTDVREAKELLLQKGFLIDYVEIANADTLELVENWNGKQKVVALAAAFLNNVRLIDNMLINT